MLPADGNQIPMKPIQSVRKLVLSAEGRILCYVFSPITIPSQAYTLINNQRQSQIPTAQKQILSGINFSQELIDIFRTSIESDDLIFIRKHVVCENLDIDYLLLPRYLYSPQTSHESVIQLCIVQNIFTSAILQKTFTRYSQTSSACGSCMTSDILFWQVLVIKDSKNKVYVLKTSPNCIHNHKKLELITCQHNTTRHLKQETGRR